MVTPERTDDGDLGDDPGPTHSELDNVWAVVEARAAIKRMPPGPERLAAIYAYQEAVSG